MWLFFPEKNKQQQECNNNNYISDFYFFRGKDIVFLMQNSGSLRPLPSRAEGSQDGWVKPWRRGVLEKNVHQAPFDLRAWDPAQEDVHLWDFLESHFQDEQVKLNKKLGDHVPALGSLAGPIPPG